MGIFDIFGGSNKDETDVSSKISKIIDLIDQSNKIQSTNQISSSHMSSSDSIFQILSNLTDVSNDSELNAIISSAAVPKERLDRYLIYDEIYQYVPLSKRMLRVYIANIMQKNPIVKKSIFVDSLSDALSKYDQVVINQCKDYAKTVIDAFGIKDHLKLRILPYMLRYGDCFVEIVDVDSELSSIKNSNVLTESQSFEALFKELQTSSNLSRSYSAELLIDKAATLIFEDATLDYTRKSDGDISLQDIKIRIHKPHNIIILCTPYGETIGYIEVQPKEFNVAFNLLSTLAGLVGRVTNLGTSADISSSSDSYSEMIQRIAKYFIGKIVENSLGKNPSTHNNIDLRLLPKIIKSLPDDISRHIARFIVSTGLHKQNGSFSPSRVRFIPTSRMVHFRVSSSEYDPYGMSFLDPLVFHSKLYIISQVAGVIAKLSRAAPLRKWIIETGSTKMHSSLIQELKRRLQNTRVTLDDISSFKSIPKILSDFKDMFILSKGGSRPLDFEIVMHGDPNIRLDDLESARRELMSISGIPPVYLGYADIVELREQLVHTNISFATEIIDMQESISGALVDFVEKVSRVQGVSLPLKECISVDLMPPVVLLLQLIELMLTSTGNINNILQSLNIPVDPYYLLEKYVPFVDWEVVKSKGQQYRVEKATQDELSTASAAQMMPPGV